MTKILDLDVAIKIKKKFYRSGRKVVLIHGCFDTLHRGHLRLFTHAKKHGTVFCGVDNDQSVRELKGLLRPIYSINERIRAIKKPELLTIFLF